MLAESLIACLGGGPHLPNGASTVRRSHAPSPRARSWSSIATHSPPVRGLRQIHSDDEIRGVVFYANSLIFCGGRLS